MLLHLVNRVEDGEKSIKSDETSTNVDATFSCVDCGRQFKSRRELDEHERAVNIRLLRNLVLICDKQAELCSA